MKTLFDIILGFYLMKNCKWLIPIAFLMSDKPRTSEDGCFFFALIIGIFLLFLLIALIVMAIPV